VKLQADRETCSGDSDSISEPVAARELRMEEDGSGELEEKKRKVSIGGPLLQTLTLNV